MRKNNFLKKIFAVVFCIILALSLLCGCKKTGDNQGGSVQAGGASQGTTSQTGTGGTSQGGTSQAATFDPAIIPKFNGEDYVIEVNDNYTFFNDDELLTEYTANLSELDYLDRAQVAWMCADEAHIQTGERGSIYELKPTGWHGGGFYERSHLLMWKLSGINDIRNLVTGTATFNEDNMQYYEKKVTAYLWDNEDNHVMYRVTPVYYDEELICRGVLMEAKSVEDDGWLEYCVFIYNAEPGAYIDYETGDYSYEVR